MVGNHVKIRKGKLSPIMIMKKMKVDLANHLHARLALHSLIGVTGRIGARVSKFQKFHVIRKQTRVLEREQEIVK